MMIRLTSEQSAEIEPHLRPGAVLLARVEREQFTGSNAGTSGGIYLVFASIPADRLDAVRRAIAGETTKPPPKKFQRNQSKTKPTTA